LYRAFVAERDGEAPRRSAAWPFLCDPTRAKLREIAERLGMRRPVNAVGYPV
jgi:hypothetical protein